MALYKKYINDKKLGGFGKDISQQKTAKLLLSTVNGYFFSAGQYGWTAFNSEGRTFSYPRAEIGATLEVSLGDFASKLLNDEN